MLRFINLKTLTQKEAVQAKALARSYYNTLSRDFKTFNLIIHIKKHDVSGKACKYSIHARIEAPTVKLSARAADWDLKKVMHESMKKLGSEVIHKFKTNMSYRKRYTR